MGQSAYVINQRVSDRLLLARLEPATGAPGSVGTAYFHDVENKAKITIVEDQVFRIDGIFYTLESVMDDYVVISDLPDFSIGENEFVINDDLFGKGDVIFTRVDVSKNKNLCYLHSPVTDAKISFRTGQRIQIGDGIYRLEELTENIAKFSREV